MATAELERLLETALREADVVPVDVAAGRRRLLGRQHRQRRKVRRLAVAVVAAGALIATVAAAILLGVRGGHSEPPPVHPPRVVTFSPSGLPVGLLKGQYPIGRQRGTLRFLVRRDGTGQIQYFDGGHSMLGPFDVGVRAGAAGRVVVTYDNPVCVHRKVLTLTVAVNRSTVRILRAVETGDCLIERAFADALAGTVLRVFPIPPGGLPQPG